MGAVAVTAEAAYITIKNSFGGITWSDLVSGQDGEIVEGKAGILFADNIQPFVHYEVVMPDASGTEDLNVYGVGCNYYIKGLGNKITAEWSKIDDDENVDVDVFTVQVAFEL